LLVRGQRCLLDAAGSSAVLLPVEPSLTSRRAAPNAQVQNVTRDHTGAPLGTVAASTNPRLIGPGKCKLFDRERLQWFSELDCWVDFKRKRVFRHRFVLAATFVSLCTDVAAESRIPGVWESYGEPLVPSDWKAILLIANLRRQTTKRGRQGHAPT
jgi:hypothetical protein